MTDKEFTDIAPSLSSAALHAAQTRGVSMAEAEDVAQDTMMRLWTLRDSLKSPEHARALAIVVAAVLAARLTAAPRAVERQPAAMV